MNKTFARSILAVAVLASASMAARADDEEASSPVSGTVALVSDYVFDGVSQTDNGPALQAGVTYSFDSGLYIGAWASNVDFVDAGDTGIETDWYIGYGGSFSDSVAFDAGVTLYKYVGLDDDADGNSVDYDYNEFYFGVTFAENLTVKLFHTSDYAGTGEKADRLKVTYGIELNDAWSIPLEYTKWMAEDAFADYNHYKVGVATSIGSVGAELSYQKTNLDDDGDSAVEDLYYTSGGFVLALSTEF